MNDNINIIDYMNRFIVYIDGLSQKNERLPAKLVLTAKQKKLNYE